MSKFKVGDRVKITARGRTHWSTNNFGKGVGIILSVQKDGRLPYTIKWDEGERNGYNYSDVELEVLNLENI